jgi:hypothetical protein
VSSFEGLLKALLQQHKKIPTAIKGVRPEIVSLTKSLHLVQRFSNSTLARVVGGGDGELSKTMKSPVKTKKSVTPRKILSLSSPAKKRTGSPTKKKSAVAPPALFVQAAWPELPPALTFETGMVAGSTSTASPLLRVAIRTSATLGTPSPKKKSPFYSRVQKSYMSSPSRVLPPRTPPYLKLTDPHLSELSNEPAQALVSLGGNKSFFDISNQAMIALKPGGIIIYEHGCSQQNEVVGVLKESGFSNIQTIKDFQGLDRIVYGYKC